MTLPRIYLATSEPAAADSGSVFDALGVDWKILVFQLVAFSLLVWLLSKFVFPTLMRAVDERQKAIEQSTEAALHAEKHAAEAQARVEQLLADAKREAADIVATAKAESASVLEKAEQKSRVQAERMVAEARESIDKEVLAAKRALHNETVELVALATEKVVGKTVDSTVDKKIISQSLKEVAQ